MPGRARIYTRAGDDGFTMLGSGRRVPKDDQRVAAYGTVDELNACIGLARACAPDAAVAAVLEEIQNDLLCLGSDLSLPAAEQGSQRAPLLQEERVTALEAHVDRLSAELQPLASFLLPGGAPCAAHLHVARTVCRRAERSAVGLKRQEEVAPAVVKYLNRLSDLLFVLARYENLKKGQAETRWSGRAATGR
ncbi:MAG: cob(I)yrinic acid a,c-diamide adenosyltransferase [Planctomycetes bacterium]|nr:cob(I)yrinic acid a,c-diamide adenosyltransferase [Planctomycetota bacterium]